MAKLNYISNISLDGYIEDATGEFAWVLPVKPGARIEVASDAWFEALDAATAVRSNAPALACDDGMGYGCGPPGAAGCSAEEAGSDISSAVMADPVTVVHVLSPDNHAYQASYISPALRPLIAKKSVPEGEGTGCHDPPVYFRIVPRIPTVHTGANAAP